MVSRMKGIKEECDEMTHLDPQSDKLNFNTLSTSHTLPLSISPSSSLIPHLPPEANDNDSRPFRMTGVDRTPKSARLATNYAGNPPRPPNAWILYRLDKMKQFANVPGQISRPQSELSKLIANMWRNESRAVRALYQMASDKKKAEHAEMYPGYRFQPLTREQKKKLREEKRLQREAAKLARHAAKGRRTVGGTSSVGGHPANASNVPRSMRPDTLALLAPYVNLTEPDSKTTSTSTTPQHPTSQLPSSTQFSGFSDSGINASSSPQTGSSRDAAPPIVRPPPSMATAHPGLTSTGLPSPPWPGALSHSNASGLDSDVSNYDQEFVLNALELGFPQGNRGFPDFDLSESFDFDFSKVPSVSATGDSSTFSQEGLDQIIANLIPSLPFDLVAPDTDFNTYLIDYDGKGNRHTYDFGTLPDPFTEESTEPGPNENPIPSTSSDNLLANRTTRVTSQATNDSSVVSPLTHVSPAAPMSRTPSYDASVKTESPMSPVSTISSPGVQSAPEPRVKTPETPEPTPASQTAIQTKPSARRVGGDWRRVFPNRIPLN